MAREGVPARLRQAVSRRARGRCEYCRGQERFATHGFSVEHIVPRSAGGKTIYSNLAFACQGCNNHKYTNVADRDPMSGDTVPLFHPRQDAWEQHFVWNEDYTVIIGITPVGRATVESLRLNRPGVVNLRRVLFEIGEHPR